MKKCSVCGELKDYSGFSYQNKSAGTRVSRCKSCYSRQRREFRISNPEKQKQADREAYQRQRERKLAYAREYRAKFPLKTKDVNMRSKYGIGINDYNAMRIAQNGKCLICGEHERNLKRVLCVDHCHNVGKVRGLLCDTCNKFLGFYEKLATNCADYLREYG